MSILFVVNVQVQEVQLYLTKMSVALKVFEYGSLLTVNILVFPRFELYKSNNEGKKYGILRNGRYLL